VGILNSQITMRAIDFKRLYIYIYIYIYDTGKKEKRSQLPESEDKLPLVSGGILQETI